MARTPPKEAGVPAGRSGDPVGTVARSDAVAVGGEEGYIVGRTHGAIQIRQTRKPLHSIAPSEGKPARATIASCCEQLHERPLPNRIAWQIMTLGRIGQAVER